MCTAYGFVPRQGRSKKDAALLVRGEKTQGKRAHAERTWLSWMDALPCFEPQCGAVFHSERATVSHSLIRNT